MMKIMVFDDSELHRRAAAAQLKDHELTLVATFDEAVTALTPVVAGHRRDALLVDAGFEKGFNPFRDTQDEEKRKAYWVAYDEATKLATVYPAFDAVLSDLLVPASRKTLGPASLHMAGQEMPLGTIIALLAMTAGVKMVAVVTDTNHHNHPASAALDHFPEKPAAGCNVFCTNRALGSFDAETWEKVGRQLLESDEGKLKYPRQPDYSYRGLVHAKDWASVLASLTAER